GPTLAKLGQAGSNFREALSKVGQTGNESIAQTEAANKKVNVELGRPDVQEAMRWLTPGKLPPVTTAPMDDPRIKEALGAIRERQPDRETIPLLRQVSESSIQHAIELAESNVQAVEQVDKPISAALGRIDALVHERVGAAQRFYRTVRELDEAAA